MKKLSIVSFAVLSTFAQAEETSEQKSVEAAPNMEHMQILGRSNTLRTESGSATLIDELALEKMEYDDIHRVLANVPGVNIRQEDGYGLRPNIGFRGVTPERSKKINILEDGVLIGPAPYSAPAAYYFPSVNLMTSVEVFKGPAAIKYGPNTVAGTLNMTTREIPDDLEGQFELGLGSNGYQKLHGFVGNATLVASNQMGFLIEALSTQADGFKDIDNAENSLFDSDSGFVKNDLLTKLNYQFDGKMFGQDVQHYVELKVVVNDEDSNETYLGLATEDFEASPYRRYAASQAANMKWEHDQVLLTHNLSGENFSWTNRVYNNNFARAWRKLNKFKSGASLQDVLASPEGNPELYQVLTGEKDTETGEILVVGTNDRSYFSRGWQSDASFSLSAFDLEHIVNTGVRFHQDRIDRDHFEQDYLMRSAVLQTAGQAPYFTTVNYEETDAVSVYAENTVVLDKLQLTAGVRGEMIDSRYQNEKEGSEQDWLEKSTTTWLYSVSGFYSVTDEIGAFFGIHEGFVPTSPKQSPETEAEKSINYEIGGRYQNSTSKMEAVIFFNDFSNLKESCTASSSSRCNEQGELDQEFNAGNVDVYGLELSGEIRFAFTDSIDLPVSVTYTHTQGEFKDQFSSDFELWGDVMPGDPVPYLPENQLTLNVGLDNSHWQLNLLVKYIGEMEETAGSGEAFTGFKTDNYTVVDLSGRYEFDDQHSVYLKIDNLLDKVALVSSRPYGARPSKPQQAFVGYKYQF